MSLNNTSAKMMMTPLVRNWVKPVDSKQLFCNTCDGPECWLTLSSTSAWQLRATRHFKMRDTWTLWQVFSKAGSFICIHKTLSVKAICIATECCCLCGTLHALEHVTHITGLHKYSRQNNSHHCSKHVDGNRKHTNQVLQHVRRSTTDVKCIQLMKDSWQCSRNLSGR